MSDPVVQTTSGSVRGTVQGEVNVFKGIRYGADTGGANRFLPPKRPEPWPDVRDATAYGNASPQPVGGSPFARHPELSQIIPARPLADLSEDCLFLNVWSRGLGDGGRRPVMVWLHGGGWTAGSGGSPVYDGCALANRGDVVVVTVNHRLSILGYLYLGDVLGKEYARSGSAGLVDMVLALEWVRDNIEAFGGDPGNVTIFGESGGGVKVHALLATPAAKGLFHRAAIQSGSAHHWSSKEEGARLTNAVLEELGLDRSRAREILTVPWQDLIKAQGAVMRRNNGSGGLVGTLGSGDFGVMPVVDGIDLPEDPAVAIANGAGSDIPLMIGSNKDEAGYFVTNTPDFQSLTEEELHSRLEGVLGSETDSIIGVYRQQRPGASPADLLMAIGSGIEHRRVRIAAANKAAGGRAPVFVYMFTWETPIAGGVIKSPHTIEIPFVFDNVDATPITGDGADRYDLAAVVSSTWLAFAQNGNPNHEGLPHWPAFAGDAPATMVLDHGAHVEANIYEPEMKAWDPLATRIVH
jgi:para-nitrobenzyl esterase